MRFKKKRINNDNNDEIALNDNANQENKYKDNDHVAICNYYHYSSYYYYCYYYQFQQQKQQQQ